MKLKEPDLRHPQAVAIDVLGEQIKRGQMEQSKLKLEGDITFRKHRANTQSMEAHKNTNKDRDCKRILDLLKAKGFKGATCEEISIELQMPYQTASGRCAELKHKLKLIIETGERRRTTRGSQAAVLALKVG